MSKENREVHIAILESEEQARFKNPEDRCLQLSTPMELKKALKVADRYSGLLYQYKGLVFIEEEGVKATKKLQCDSCDNRSGWRQNLEHLMSKFPPETR